MIFNGIDFSEKLKISNIRRPMIAPQSITLKKVPGKPGKKFVRKDLEEIRVEIDVEIKDTTKSNLRAAIRDLASMLYTTEEKVLILPDETNLYYMAILSGDTNLDELTYLGKTTLTFICSDALAYGADKSGALGAVLINNGSYPTKGVITVTLDVAADPLQVSLTGSGEAIYIQEGLIGDVFIIDLELETVKRNGALDMTSVYLESDFFELPVGEFTVNTSHGSGTLAFKERWL